MPKKHFRPRRVQPASDFVRLERMYPVYARKVLGSENVLGELPLTFIDAKTREEWLAQGAVVSISRGKAVRLLLNLSPKKQQSVTMGAAVMDGVVERKPYAMACLAAWGACDRKDGVAA